MLHASLAKKLTNLEFLTIIFYGFSPFAIGHFARLLRSLCEVAEAKVKLGVKVSNSLGRGRYT